MPKSATLRWYGPRVEREIRELMKSRLVSAADAVIDRWRQNISTPAPPHSTPGEFPHEMTGDMANKLTYSLDHRSLTVRLTCTSEHFLFVEFGTENMAARPSARRTMLEMRPEMRRILIQGTGTKGQYKFVD